MLLILVMQDYSGVLKRRDAAWLGLLFRFTRLLSHRRKLALKRRWQYLRYLL